MYSKILQDHHEQFGLNILYFEKYQMNEYPHPIPAFEIFFRQDIIRIWTYTNNATNNYIIQWLFFWDTFGMIHVDKFTGIIKLCVKNQYR